MPFTRRSFMVKCVWDVARGGGGWFNRTTDWKLTQEMSFHAIYDLHVIQNTVFRRHVFLVVFDVPANGWSKNGSDFLINSASAFYAVYLVPEMVNCFTVNCLSFPSVSLCIWVERKESNWISCIHGLRTIKKKKNDNQISSMLSLDTSTDPKLTD